MEYLNFNIYYLGLNFCLISDKIMLIILIFFLIIDIILDYKYKNTVKYLQYYIGRIIFSLSIIIINLIVLLIFNLHPNNMNAQYFLFNNQIIINNGIISLKIIILLILILILITMYDNIKVEKILSLEIPIILLISVLGMFLILCSNDLFILGLGLELQTMPFFILSCLKRTSNLSVEAALKYFIYACFCSSISFFGISLIYGFLGTTNFIEIKIILNINNILNYYIIYISLCLILLGLLFKLGLFPFHFWIADVYEGCPNIITYFFAVISKFTIIFILIKLYYNVFINFLNNFLLIFLIIGVISVIIGSILALYQTKFKKLLAYSAVVHMGNILILFSIGTIEGINYALNYLFIYMLISINIFTIFLNIYKIDNSPIQNIVDFIIITKSNNHLTIGLVISILSLGGIPPFAGFFAKLPVFFLLLKTINPFISILLILTSILSVVYYIRLIRMCWYSEQVGNNPINFIKNITIKQCILISIIVCININFIWLQVPLINYIKYINYCLWI